MRRVLECGFYVLSILLCTAAVCFILSLYQYDSCRSVQESDLLYHTGEITAFSSVRGTTYLELAAFPGVDFAVDEWAIDDVEAFEKRLEESLLNNQNLRIGYTSNTLWEAQREVIFLQCDDIVFASAASHEAVVRKNNILQGVGLLFFGVATVYLMVRFIKELRQERRSVPYDFRKA